jgi:hypothetical protein
MKKHGRRQRQQQPRKNALARRPKQASPSLLRAGAPVRFNTTEPALQYLLDSTLLGELALHWSADWLTGLFSITDFPPEWVALIRASIRGGWHEAAYSGAEAGVFSSQELWDGVRWSSTTVDIDEPPASSQAPATAKQATNQPAEPVVRMRPALPDRNSSTL